MCTYYYLHHHHLPPCTRSVDMVVHYVFCGNAGVDAATSARTPCGNVHYDHAASVDYTDPCASGGCLASPDCSSGGCRLEQLNGRWTCCRCGKGGNEYRWCMHRLRRSPDTLCYHTCCATCRPDESGRGSGGGGSGAGGGGSGTSSGGASGSASGSGSGGSSGTGSSSGQKSKSSGKSSSSRRSHQVASSRS